ncbi:MAG: LPS export ABC transporter periplasmic protein LptC [Rhodanobacter sp.]|nr:MAG: LPS export ABC transporter periplasmic protein LptC [Rhodanobacter sp.]TAM13296.1 MAG: LPS export ABC transporter periplasmic protein LptC [Rhodanobacter sp.]TAM35420.1 MAG: LPS export ABC transporter periplasmic protein LptC [Rhodanobacter sp.]
MRLWLRDRKLASAIVAVGLAAGLAQLVLWWIGPTPKPNDFVGPPRSGYVLNDAHVWSYNEQGAPAFRMTSPSIERREGDESLYIDHPVFDLAAKKAGVPDWHGQSLYGWVNRAGTLIKLQGPVTMQRPAYADNAAAELTTSDVEVWPKENRMATAAPAQMTQGARKMGGIGLRASLNDNHLELLDDSHGTFPPRKHKS